MQKIYATIFLAVIFIIATSLYFGFIDQSNIAATALSLFGTFFGATFAFRLNQYKESIQLESKHREAINRALFILIRQYNAVLEISKDFRNYSTTIEKAFNMPAFKPPPYSDLTHNFNDLEFLLSSKNPNIIFELSIEQERFYQTMESIKIRNEFHVNEFQILAEKNKLHGKSLTSAEIEALLGTRVFNASLQSVMQVEENVVKFIESCPKMLTSLTVLTKEIYPKHKFICIEMQA
jgi:hypothetical protein